MSSAVVALAIFIIGSLIWPCIEPGSYQPGILMAQVPNHFPEWLTLLCFYVATYAWGQASGIFVLYCERLRLVLLGRFVFLPLYLVAIAALIIGGLGFTTPGYDINLQLFVWLALAIISVLFFCTAIIVSFTRPVGETPRQRWTPNG